MPDFRAEERTFQLLTQLAGRSGRDAPGRVIVQTFQPDARAVVHAARHDVEGFLAGELERRRELAYPPFRHLVRVVVAGPEAGAPLVALQELAAGLEAAELLGPAPLLRLRGRHRAQLLAKTAEPRRVAARVAPTARRGRARDAPRGPHDLRRRRSAESLAPTLAPWRTKPASSRRRANSTPRRQARRRLALAQIRQYPDPALRLRANEVEQFDEALRSLAERMTELMEDAQGVGLAATQVGVLQRLFVFAVGEDEPRVLVNPKIVEQSGESETADEGCLSLQRVLVPVERSCRVTIAAQDLDGDDLRLELDELAARVAQHELDHLDGVLILDRTTKDARREAMGALRAQLTLA